MMQCDPATPGAAPSPASLERLPVDVLLQLAQQLDGVSLAALDGASSELRSSFKGELSPIWRGLQREIDDDAQSPKVSGAFAERVPTVGNGSADHECKAAFARTWAGEQHRCPRCGKQGRQPVLDDGGTPDTAHYMHLCNWLLPK